MTLIIASAAPENQIIVTDRLVTDFHTGQPIDDAHYKLLLYTNSTQGYGFGVAFTGLASLGQHRTTEWLMEILPKTMSPQVEIGLGALAFAKKCSETFAQITGIPHAWKATTFVFCGRFETFGTYRDAPEPPCPFVAVISNSVDEHGRQVGVVSPDFRVLKWARSHYNPRRRPTTSVCRGDIGSAATQTKALRTLFRQLRRDIPHKAKLHLATDYVRLVADASSVVGHDLLSVALLGDSTYEGGEHPVDTAGTVRTMPHLVTAEGAQMTNFRIVSPAGFQH